MDRSPDCLEDALIMAPSLGVRFSGINATMEALLPSMRKVVPIACCGTKLSERMPRTSLWSWLCSPERKNWRIWHARRNNDMLLGLFLRHVLGQKLILLWTSAAQRKHTWITRFCYHRMDKIIATTEKAATYLDRPAVVSHHGVDASLYEPPQSRSAARQKLGLDDRPTLAVFGRIAPKKGIGDLVAALFSVLPRFPQWQVVLVGETTPDQAMFQSGLKERLTAAGIHDRVHFTGFLKDHSQLPSWYQAADVIGCVSRNEGFGITCLEGMASGCPVLATEAGAWPDIITPGKDGWLARAHDAEDLARALKTVLGSSPETLRRMGKSARETILARFTIEHEYRRIIEVYDELFREFGRPDWKPTSLQPAVRSAA